jgi:hypothetical protein
MTSLFAQVHYELPEASGESLLLPRVALTRTARFLDASAQVVRAIVSPDLPGDAGPTLADAFARDASTLRSLLGENAAKGSNQADRGGSEPVYHA